MKRSVLLPLLSAASLLPLAQGAFAQENGPAAFALDEVVVTAQRRVESAQKAAIAIDVASQKELINAGVVTSATLNALAPSLYIAKGGGSNTSYFIRGVGNFTNNGYSDPAVAFNLDGVYLGRPTSSIGTFYDLERVEVLKGPQGTLYGRNATGGAINVIPAKPKLGEVSGYAAAGYGRFDTIDLEAAVNAPLGDSVAIRLAGKFVEMDGINDDGTADDEGEALRGQIYGELNETVNIRIAADYSHSGGVGPGPSYVGTMRYTPGAPASATAPVNYTFMPAPAGLGPRTGYHTPAADAYHSTFVIGGAFINPASLNYPYQDTTNWGVNAEINANFDFATLTVIPAYRESTVDTLFNGPGFRGGLTDEKDEQFSLEARLAGENLGPIDWLVGAYYFDEDIAAQYTFSQYIVQSYQDFTTGTESIAAFGRLTAHVNDTFRLVAAGRYTDDQKNFSGTGTTLIESCTNAPPPGGPGCFGGPSVPVARSFAHLATIINPALIPAGLPVAPFPPNARPFGANGNILFFIPLALSEPLKSDRFTYRLAAEYDVGPDSLLYASYETGYRSGGYSFSVGHETYDPEYISAITIGSKNRFFDDRVQLNVELFRWRYRNQQVSHFGIDANGGNSYFTENVGRSIIQGVDIDGQFAATPTTILSASVQYLDSELKDFVYHTPRGATFLPPVVGCPFSATGIDSAGNPSYAVNCSGKTGYNSPKWSINGGVEQTFELDAFKIVFNGDARYRSNRVIGFDYLPQQNSGDDFTLDAALSFGDLDDRWTLTAWIRNITDEDVPNITQYAGAAGGVITSAYLPPRTYGVRVRGQF